MPWPAAGVAGESPQNGVPCVKCCQSIPRTVASSSKTTLAWSLLSLHSSCCSNLACVLSSRIEGNAALSMFIRRQHTQSFPRIPAFPRRRSRFCICQPIPKLIEAHTEPARLPHCPTLAETAIRPHAPLPHSQGRLRCWPGCTARCRRWGPPAPSSRQRRPASPGRCPRRRTWSAARNGSGGGSIPAEPRCNGARQTNEERKHRMDKSSSTVLVLVW